MSLLQLQQQSQEIILNINKNALTLTTSKFLLGLEKVYHKKVGGPRGGTVPLYPYEELYRYLKLIEHLDNSMELKQSIHIKQLERGRGRPIPDHGFYTLSKLRHICKLTQPDRYQREMLTHLTELKFLNVKNGKRRSCSELLYSMNNNGKNFIKRYEELVEKLNKEF